MCALFAELQTAEPTNAALAGRFQDCFGTVYSIDAKKKRKRKCDLGRPNAKKGTLSSGSDQAVTCFNHIVTVKK